MEIKKTIINKAKVYIKYLNTSIDIVYDIFTIYLFISFFALITIAKYIVIAITQTYISQAKIATQVYTSLLTNVI